jgi:DNA-binding NarL/FixJ family response regulator
MIPLTDEDAAAVAGLSPRLRDLLTFIGKGLHSEEIAELMHVSVFTVRDHTKTLFQALGVHRRVEAAVIAAKAGLV